MSGEVAWQSVPWLIAPAIRTTRELVSAEQPGEPVLYAVYRDTKTRVEYAVEVGRDEATLPGSISPSGGRRGGDGEQAQWTPS